MAICAQVIFGQYEEPFLEVALNSVSWVDYFVACNTSPNTEQGRKNEDIFFSTTGYSNISSLVPDENGHFSFAEARNRTLRTVNDDDFVLILDSDDVHYPEWETIVKEQIDRGADSITAHFYHLMVYKNIYQYVQPREIVYKKYNHTQWVQGVHEQLITTRNWPVTVPYHYMHYGYIKPQKEVFNRWKFYSDLDGDFHHYDGQNPEHILDDRISVSKPIEAPHPPAVKEVLKKYPLWEDHGLYNKEAVPIEKVGLIMLVCKGDAPKLEQALKSLYATPRYPDYEILYILTGAGPPEFEVVNRYSLSEEEIVDADSDTSLTEALNFGLDFFRVRHDIQYIGWVHPDMKFDNRDWLYYLWKELDEHPKIGKICAANTRDQLPTTLIPGHEQCFIIRKDIINKIGLFDEKFIGIGGYEDWDMNRRILNHNDYKVMISPRAKVYHEGMSTRSRRDTTREQQANSAYYFQKYGTYDAPV